MLKTLIVIASKKRAHLTFSKGTLSWLLQVPNVEYCLALESDDVPSYLIECPNLDFIELPETNRGMGYALAALKAEASRRGYTYIWKIDDDIRHFRAASAKHEFAVKNFQDAASCLNGLFEKGFDGVGFPYGNAMFSRSEIVSSLSPSFKTVYAIKLDFWKPSPDISTFEDFYTTLNFRNLGGRGAMSGQFGFETLDVGKYIGGTEGGLQLFDRKALAEKEIAIFKKMGCGVRIKPETSWYYEPILPKPVRLK